MTIAITWVFVGALVGALIGQKKHRTGEGLTIGLLLGPLGWLVMALSPSHGPKCPACKGDIAEGASRCRHCGETMG